ncbi:retrovirus-related pol polyprotein from transposon TNT 1-94 [Tanacetum coccineum]
MQGTSLSKQERECKLYDEFDKFTYIKEESLHHYYLRFSYLMNIMNIYKMTLQQFQVNTKFLNSILLEWSKFVTDVKLVKDLHTTNFDQINAYLEQHELHANEVRLMRTRANTSGTGGRTSGQQRVVKCFNCQREGHMARQYHKRVSVTSKMIVDELHVSCLDKAKYLVNAARPIDLNPIRVPEN